MQIVSNLDEMSNLFSAKKEKNVINLSSAEFAQRVVKVNDFFQSQTFLNIYLVLPSTCMSQLPCKSYLNTIATFGLIKPTYFTNTVQFGGQLYNVK